MQNRRSVWYAEQIGPKLGRKAITNTTRPGSFQIGPKANIVKLEVVDPILFPLTCPLTATRLDKRMTY